MRKKLVAWLISLGLGIGTAATACALAIAFVPAPEPPLNRILILAITGGFGVAAFGTIWYIYLKETK